MNKSNIASYFYNGTGCKIKSKSMKMNINTQYSRDICGDNFEYEISLGA